MSRARNLIVAMLLATSLSAPAMAGDLGTMGNTFPISERDILEYIAGQIAKAKAAGKLPAMQREFTERVKKRVERPKPVEGLRKTEAPRTWLFDPTITVPQNFKHPDGRVFARAGDRINPLERMPGFDRVMILIDGDDPDQVAFGLRKLKQVGVQRGRLILTNGAPLELMRKNKVQVYFDQEGRISGHFAVRQVPAVIERDGLRMRISEVRP